MAANKKDVSLIIWLFGWLLELAVKLRKLIKEQNIPFEAFERLGTDQGEATLTKILEIVHADWQAEQTAFAEATADEPQVPEFVESAGGHPYRNAPPGSISEVAAVPDLSPGDLLSQVEKKIGLTFLNPSFKTWDFCQFCVAEGQPVRFLEVRGKRYEVLTWKPGKRVTTQRVRKHFKDLGADGNTAAFLVWITETELMGCYVSIPSDNDLLYHSSIGSLCAPYFDCDGTSRGLHLLCVKRDWDDNWEFVAFRELY